MKNRTKKIISFGAVIMFIIGSYGMGNGFFDTFNSTLINQFISSLAGVAMCAVCVFIIAICVLVYNSIYELLSENEN